MIFFRYKSRLKSYLEEDSQSIKNSRVCKGKTKISKKILDILFIIQYIIVAQYRYITQYTSNKGGILNGYRYQPF